MNKTSFLILFLSVIMLNMCRNSAEVVNYKYTDYHIDGKIPYNFTLYENGNNNLHQIIYYFHGANGNSRTWLQGNHDIIKFWQSKNQAMPMVAALSFGPGWMLIPKNKSQRSGYLEYFIQEVMPTIEKKSGLQIKKRFIIGFSMGGHNAAQIIGRYPDIFDKAVILSPAILPFSPFSSDNEIEQYIDRVKKQCGDFYLTLKQVLFNEDTISKDIHYIIMKYKEYIPDQESWENSFIIPNILSEKKTTPEVYISCGNKDNYGFFIGADLLNKALNKSNYKSQLKILDGKHIIKNPQEIVNFLIDN